MNCRATARVAPTKTSFLPHSINKTTAVEGNEVKPLSPKGTLNRMANIKIYPYYFYENKGTKWSDLTKVIRGECDGDVLLLRGLPKNKGFQGIDCVELAGSVAGQARRLGCGSSPQ